MLTGLAVKAALSDLEGADICAPLKATLRLLQKLTRIREVDAEDTGSVLAAGVSRQQIEDARSQSVLRSTP